MEVIPLPVKGAYSAVPLPLFRHAAGDLLKFGGDIAVILPPVGEHAAAAILDALLGVAEVAAAVRPQGVEGTVAEKAVEVVRVVGGVAGEVLALPVGEEGKGLVFPGKGAGAGAVTLTHGGLLSIVAVSEAAKKLHGPRRAAMVSRLQRRERGTLSGSERFLCASYAGRYSDFGVQRGPRLPGAELQWPLGTPPPTQQRLCAGFSPDFPCTCVPEIFTWAGGKLPGKDHDTGFLPPCQGGLFPPFGPEGGKKSPPSVGRRGQHGKGITGDRRASCRPRPG